MGWVTAILGVIAGVGIGVWLWFHLFVHLPLEQFVKITEKRHAELLDLQRRQEDER